MRHQAPSWAGEICIKTLFHLILLEFFLFSRLPMVCVKALSCPERQVAELMSSALALASFMVCPPKNHRIKTESRKIKVDPTINLLFFNESEFLARPENHQESKPDQETPSGRLVRPKQGPLNLPASGQGEPGRRYGLGENTGAFRFLARQELTACQPS